MPLPGVLIEEITPAGAGLSSRADVAVFAGFIGRSEARLPRGLLLRLEDLGWAGSGPFARDPALVEALLDVPVPVQSWSQFESLFDWQIRLIEPGDERRIPCALGLAVKSFFAEGGAMAWIVRCGDPIPLMDRTLSDADERARRRQVISWVPGAPPPDAAERVPLIPGHGSLGTPADPFDPRTWTGTAHIWGIEGAAMLLLPDLPDLMAGRPEPAPEVLAPPPPPERFKPCAPLIPGVAPRDRTAPLPLQAPRIDGERATDWAEALRSVLDLLALPRGPAHRRDVMLLASLPIPTAGGNPLAAADPSDPMGFLDTVTLPGGAALLNGAGLGSARLQLAYPWVATDASRPMPEGVEGGEGVLAGALARSALTLGAFRSAGNTVLDTVRLTLPRLGTSDLRNALPSGRSDWLGDRLCLIGRKTGQNVLLSDATMGDPRIWRPGGVSRLMGILLRAGRDLGQDLVFDASGEDLWADIRNALEALMEQLRALGAFAGTSPDQSYTVRCDRTTMTQSDIDNGRVIAEVSFLAAQPIERVTVALALTGALPGTLREVA